MVYRIYVEKRAGFRQEAQALLKELRTYLHLDGLTKVRILNRYDAEGVTGEEFAAAVRTVFSEPQVDTTDEILTLPKDAYVFAAEALPGQFDQRADSAAQCIQLQTMGERPLVRYAKVFCLMGDLGAEDAEKVKRYVINPVEMREASFALPDSLAMDKPQLKAVQTLDGFRTLDAMGRKALLDSMGLAMDEDDLAFVQEHFLKEQRDPTVTELRVMDTYWSDHCRHTTFLTELDDVRIDDDAIGQAYSEYLAAKERLAPHKPRTLMELATIAARQLKKEGRLIHLDESEEINACTVRIKADTVKGEEDYLLLFKNETHNHPTEIEPFGGAATCIGGAIRDPLSARSYVYASMRVTGAADPTKPLSETIPGKLPQRKLCAGAAAGFSSYGNQIGLATGCVEEIYHDGYAAKRLETGAVLGAAPLQNVRRERPLPGDIVILLGGRTGRDGIGGATGSSKAHTEKSVDTCASEVQKGNAPEERKLQRLFLNPAATLLIKRCNDFGAGGVSVAVGELADGLTIDLDRVPLKYAGLDGTEIAISESQERMAVVVAPEDADAFCALAEKENLESSPVAVVTESPRMVMRWQGQTVVDLDRDFLSSNGAKKRTDAHVAAPSDWQRVEEGGFADTLMSMAASLKGCSRQGLSERFDSTIGVGTVLMPFGGKNQLTPPEAMVHTLPIPGGTETASYMAFGFNPYIAEKSPYHGAYLAVVESVSKLVAAGAKFEHVYLSLQEFFPRPGREAKRWGLPLAAMLGAYKAQMDLGIAAIGGKDSMSGSFEDLDVPPTLISFAVTWGKAAHALSPEFKGAKHAVVWIRPETDAQGLPKAESLKAVFESVTALARSGRALSVSAVGEGGAAKSVQRAVMGNGAGFMFEDGWSREELFGYRYGSFLVEMADEDALGYPLLGHTADKNIVWRGETADTEKLLAAYQGTLETVYPVKAAASEEPVKAYTFEGERKKGVSVARPRVLIPAFPGTNCEIDTARAFERAGAIADIMVVRNLRPDSVAESVREMARRMDKAQIVLIPGGFSGGDEPEGSGKLITSFFRSAEIRDAVDRLLNQRDGLMGGICNGFQALVKLGLVPYGRITDTDENSPTLTYNLIGRHQSRLVRVKVCSTLSPWFSLQNVGDTGLIPISHGEGRFVMNHAGLETLSKNGQIAAQYVDDAGNPSMDIAFNPAGSMQAVEAVTSPDGRVLGRMGHSERMLGHLYRNVPGAKDDPLFMSAVAYYK